MTELAREEYTKDKMESPLYKKMNVVMHGVIFMYASAFWIQTGVLPVSIRVPYSLSPIVCRGLHSKGVG